MLKERREVFGERRARDCIGNPCSLEVVTQRRDHRIALVLVDERHPCLGAILEEVAQRERVVRERRLNEVRMRVGAVEEIA